VCLHTYTHNNPVGCDSALVEECVCDQDAFCCKSHWDDTCAEKVILLTLFTLPNLLPLLFLPTLLNILTLLTLPTFATLLGGGVFSYM
jgi:hypothetical protein